jgi:hypothetical protein
MSRAVVAVAGRRETLAALAGRTKASPTQACARGNRVAPDAFVRGCAQQRAIFLNSVSSVTSERFP